MSNRFDASLSKVQTELSAERTARVQLDGRVARLENSRQTRPDSNKSDIAVAVRDNSEICSDAEVPWQHARHRFWASENKPAAERRRSKIESKIKKFAIELDGIAPQGCHCELQDFPNFDQTRAKFGSCSLR